MSVKSRDEKSSVILREQVQLLKAEKEIQAMLSKINENINSLKVEELQLLATSVSYDIKPNISINQSEPPSSSLQSPIITDNATEINKQTLILDIWAKPEMIQEEEVDSDY